LSVLTYCSDAGVEVNYPLCTIAHTPRLPEHCVEYVRLLMWPKDNPFGGLSPARLSVCLSVTLTAQHDNLLLYTVHCTLDGHSEERPISAQPHL